MEVQNLRDDDINTKKFYKKLSENCCTWNHHSLKDWNIANYHVSSKPSSTIKN